MSWKALLLLLLQLITAFRFKKNFEAETIVQVCRDVLDQVKASYVMCYAMYKLQT